MAGIKRVFGGAQLRAGGSYDSIEALEEMMAVLKENDVSTIDTAQLYGESEEKLGSVKAGEQFTIDTKATGGFVAGSGTKEGIIGRAKESLEKLKVKQVSKLSC